MKDDSRVLHNAGNDHQIGYKVQLQLHTQIGPFVFLIKPKMKKIAIDAEKLKNNYSSYCVWSRLFLFWKN